MISGGSSGVISPGGEPGMTSGEVRRGMISGDFGGPISSPGFLVGNSGLSGCPGGRCAFFMGRSLFANSLICKFRDDFHV